MKSKGTVKKILRAMHFARPHWRLYVVVLFFSLVTSAAALATPYLSKIFFDDVLINRKVEMFALVVAAFLLLQVISRLVVIVQSFYQIKLSQMINESVKFAVFSHLESLHLGFYREKKSGDLIYRITSDISSIQSLISSILDEVGTNVLSFAAALGIALTIDWRVTAVSLAVAMIYVLANRYFLRRQVKARKGLLESSSEILSFLSETFESYLIIKIYGKEKERADEFAKKTTDFDKLTRHEFLLASWLAFFGGILTYLPIFAVTAYGGWRVMNGEMTVGDLIALQLYVPLLYSPLLRLAGIYVTINLSMLSADRVFELLDIDPEIKDSPGAKHIAGIKGHVKAENVSFTPGRNGVLRNADFEAVPGEVTAMAGPSGVGKTTLAYLLARLYDPQEGRVFLDGIDLRDIRLKSLREHVGFVTQEPFIFTGTINENIRFSKKATKEDMKAAATAANAAGFIDKMPKGYATHVGTHGSKLSEGQQQRIALARAFVRKPRVLIIDEGFNAVDARSERRIMEALKHYAKKGNTVILTSHRLSVLKEADRIYLLKEGRVVEKGGCKELIGKKGEFYSLYKYQLKK